VSARGGAGEALAELSIGGGDTFAVPARLPP